MKELLKNIDLATLNSYLRQRGASLNDGLTSDVLDTLLNLNVFSDRGLDMSDLTEEKLAMYVYSGGIVRNLDHMNVIDKWRLILNED